MRTTCLGIDDDLNLYAYTGNDPLNGSDPLGLECVDDGNRSQCDHPDPSVPDVSHPSNDGKPNEISPKADGFAYHDYKYDNDVGSADQISAAEAAAQANPTPGDNDQAATAAGVVNDASPGDKPKDMVTSYVAPITVAGEPTGRQAVINVTQPGHTFHDGYVVVYFTVENGRTIMHVAGEGNSKLQKALGGVGVNWAIWKRQAGQIRDALRGRK